MTPAEIARRVEEIREIRLDCESAHAEEDALFADVLRAIKSGLCSDPAACAAEALRSLEIKFPRYCA